MQINRTEQLEKTGRNRETGWKLLQLPVGLSLRDFGGSYFKGLNVKRGLKERVLKLMLTAKLYQDTFRSKQ